MAQADEASRAPLAEYFAHHPKSKLEQLEFDGECHSVVTLPWEDTSLALYLPEDDGAALFEALNNVVLPARLSAVYHLDAHDLEIICTAHKLFPLWKR